MCRGVNISERPEAGTKSDVAEGQQGQVGGFSLDGPGDFQRGFVSEATGTLLTVLDIVPNGIREVTGEF